MADYVTLKLSYCQNGKTPNVFFVFLAVDSHVGRGYQNIVLDTT